MTVRMVRLLPQVRPVVRRSAAAVGSDSNPTNARGAVDCAEPAAQRNSACGAPFRSGATLRNDQYPSLPQQDDAAAVELQTGHASLHHGHLFHASGFNGTGEPVRLTSTHLRAVA